jgi:hypothetical protein
MKAIEVNAVITGIRSKVDGSLGISMGTPELSPEEKAEFMRLQGVNLIVLFNPLDEKDAPRYKIDRAVETKTPSERLRGVLYVMWEQSGMKGDFNEFYRSQMEKFIDLVKNKLN